MSATPDEVLTAEEAAKLLKVSVSHVREMAKQKKLPGLRLGARWCFSRERLLQAVRGENNGSATKTRV